MRRIVAEWAERFNEPLDAIGVASGLTPPLMLVEFGSHDLQIRRENGPSLTTGVVRNALEK
ncbi:MAG: hypothetical protein ABSG41_25055 [Bryobacteraceae bacterium]|jgi:hypothetical protein